MIGQQSTRIRRLSRPIYRKVLSLREKEAAAIKAEKAAQKEEELSAKWEADLHPDQKIYLSSYRTTVLPWVLFLTRKRMEEAD
jgi:hypothetical protein